MVTYEKIGTDGNYRLCRKDENDTDTRYIIIPDGYEERLDYIYDRFGNDAEKLQSKLQTLYLFLRSRGVAEQDFDQISLFEPVEEV